MSGSDFEDRLADALDEMAGNGGVALLRKQSMSMRRGSFQMSQEADVLLDSKRDEYYSCFECKSRDYGKVRDRGITGLYFSGDYKPEQINKQVEYRDLSGRRFFVAVEIKNFRGDDSAWLLPVEVFQKDSERGLSKVTWEKLAYLGRYIGGQDSIEIDTEDFDHTERVGRLYERSYEKYEDWVEDVDDGESLPTDTDPPNLNT